MNKIPGIEIYDLNFDFDIDFDAFNKEQDINIQDIETDYRKVRAVFIKDYDIDLLKKIQAVVSKSLEHYKNKYTIEINSHEEFLLLEYKEGGRFDDHFDDDGYGERIISMSLYLNDDYEGGEIEFTNFGELVGKIKPKKNQLFLFPSSYVYRHTAHPIKNGQKYMILSFFSKYTTRTHREFSIRHQDVFKFN
jgi:hypothetical protein